VDGDLKTRGNIYLNVETSLLFAPLYQNFWLRACVQPWNAANKSSPPSFELGRTNVNCVALQLPPKERSYNLILGGLASQRNGTEPLRTEKHRLP